MIYAPFTQDQINHINEFQNANVVHPFTCGNDGSILEAQRNGLVCPNCDWEQDWVHDGMADGSFLEAQQALLRNIVREL